MRNKNLNLKEFEEDNNTVGKLRVTAERLNVRTRPDITSPIAIIIEKGDELELMREKPVRGFYQIKMKIGSEIVEGFVAEDYAEKV